MGKRLTPSEYQIVMDRCKVSYNTFIASIAAQAHKHRAHILNQTEWSSNFVYYNSVIYFVVWFLRFVSAPDILTNMSVCETRAHSHELWIKICIHYNRIFSLRGHERRICPMRDEVRRTRAQFMHAYKQHTHTTPSFNISLLFSGFPAHTQNLTMESRYRIEYKNTMWYCLSICVCPFSLQQSIVILHCSFSIPHYCWLPVRAHNRCIQNVKELIKIIIFKLNFVACRSFIDSTYTYIFFISMDWSLCCSNHDSILVYDCTISTLHDKFR